MTTTTTFLRTSVVLPENTIDVQLPADSPVDDVVYELIRFLKVELSSQNREIKWLLDDNAVWTLERFGRRQLDGEMSLREQDVRDGERLFLTKNALNETYPGLIDDIAEAVAQYQDDFSKWESAVDAPRAARWALGVVGVFLAVGSALFVGWGLDPGGSWLRWPIAGTVLGVALLSGGLTIPLMRAGDVHLGTALLTLGYTGIACGSFMMVPRPPGLWHLAVSGSCVVVFGAVMFSLAPQAKRLHAAALSMASIITMVSIINIFYTVSPSVVGVQAATMAYLLILMSSRIAMSAARFETPYVPAAGEPLDSGGAALGDATQKSTSRAVIESVVNQREQNYAARHFLVGMLVGSAVIITGSAAFSGFYATERQWLLLAFYVSLATSLVNRGRNYMNRDAHVILLASGILCLSVYVMALVVGEPQKNVFQIAAGTGFLFFATLIGSLWALGGRSIKAPTTRRWFELVEVAMYATPIIWLGILMDIYTKARNR